MNEWEDELRQARAATERESLSRETPSAKEIGCSPTRGGAGSWQGEKLVRHVVSCVVVCGSVGEALVLVQVSCQRGAERPPHALASLTRGSATSLGAARALHYMRPCAHEAPVDRSGKLSVGISNNSRGHNKPSTWAQSKPSKYQNNSSGPTPEAVCALGTMRVGARHAVDEPELRAEGRSRRGWARQDKD
jgi:hypothetical protein